MHQTERCLLRVLRVYLYLNALNFPVLVENEIIFHLDKDVNLEIPLPINYDNLVIELAGEIITPEIEDNKIKLNVPKESNMLIVKYKTSDFLEKSSKNFFVAEFENPLEATFVFFELKLPEGSVLDKPVDQGKSAYPDPKEITSDGQRIIIKWQLEQVKKNDKIAIFVTYKDSGVNLGYFIIPIFTLILIIGYLVLKKPKIKKEITKARAKEYLDSLVSDSKIYRSIHESTYEWSKNESEASDSLYALQMFKLSQPTPATMSLVRAYRKDKIKYGKLRDTLSAIEKFHFVFTAITSSRSSGGISAMYSSFAIKLFESKDSQEASNLIQEFVAKLRDKRPSLEEFKVAFKEVVYTNSNSKQKNLVRYILEKFSLHYSYKYPVDFDELTIEHLSPQKNIDQDGWTESSIGCLGNLIFLDQKVNGEIDTKGFLEKKFILIEKGYSLPEFISNANEWNPECVYKHAEEMAEIAYSEIWRI